MVVGGGGVVVLINLGIRCRRKVETAKSECYFLSPPFFLFHFIFVFIKFKVAKISLG